MNRTLSICISMLVIFWAAARADALDVKGGLVVCFGADALESVSDDWQKPGYVFHCLETSNEAVAKACEKIEAAGCYGKVSVARFDGGRLPYIDNLVNMVVINDSRFDIDSGDIERVLEG